MSYLALFGKLVWFFLPIGFANMAPIFFKHSLTTLGRPIHEKWFGAHKTWRGLLVATVTGGIIFIIQAQLAAYWQIFQDISPYSYTSFPLWFGFLFGGAAILGDLIKSYCKRRFKIPAGDAWFPFDQIDFLLGGLAVLLLYVYIPISHWVIVLGAGMIIHVLTNQLGYRLHLKEHPW